MTAEEKSHHLYLKYLNLLIANYDLDGEDYLTKAHAKQCAIIAVDEILNCTNDNDGYINCDKTYWQEVKNHLNKL